MTRRCIPPGARFPTHCLIRRQQDAESIETWTYLVIPAKIITTSQIRQLPYSKKMPPLALSSHNITPYNAFPSHIPLLRRSPNLEGNMPSPRRGFFGGMLKSLGSLTVLEAILSNIMKAWAFVHPRHERNLAIAQHAVNMEWYEYHSAEWDEKQLRAEYRALKTYAEEKPVSYCIMLPLKWGVGTRERKLYNGILKQVNEKFYEEYKDVLGEAAGEEEVQMEFELVPQKSEFEDTE